MHSIFITCHHTEVIIKMHRNSLDIIVLKACNQQRHKFLCNIIKYALLEVTAYRGISVAFNSSFHAKSSSVRLLAFSYSFNLDSFIVSEQHYTADRSCTTRHCIHTTVTHSLTGATKWVPYFLRLPYFILRSQAEVCSFQIHGCLIALCTPLSDRRMKDNVPM